MDAHQQETGLIALAAAIATGLLASLAKDGAFWRFLGRIPLGIYRWWKRPNERQLIRIAFAELTKATTENTGEIKGIREALQHGFEQANNRIGDVINQQAINAAATRIALGESAVARWTCDSNKMCVFTNSALQRMFGRSNEEMLHLGWLDAIPPHERRKVKANFDRLYAHEDDPRYDEHYPIVVGGVLKNIHARAVEVVRDQHGKVLCVYGTCEPVQTFHDPDRCNN